MREAEQKIENFGMEWEEFPAQTENERNDDINEMWSLKEEDGVRERIKEVLRAKGTTFTAICGNGTALQSKFQRQLSKASVTFVVLSFLLNNFPDVSAEWLIRGEGEMIKKKEGGITVNAPKNTGAVTIGDENTTTIGGDNITTLLMNQILQLQQQVNNLTNALLTKQ